MNSIIEKRRQELFAPELPPAPPKPPKVRKVVGASKKEVVIELTNLKSACVFYADLLKPIIDTAEQKKINIYVYRRDRGERFSKNRIYYGIYAVPCGQPKTSKASYLTNVICSVGAYPHEVCPHGASKQHYLLVQFLKELSAYQAISPGKKNRCTETQAHL